jgi:uncharacterized sulfatase
MKNIVRVSFLSLCSLLWAEIAVAADSAPKPNIIVFFTDDHGYADLGSQGIVHDIKTPNADRLAASGVRAVQGYVTAPQCVPSRGGLMTGRFQSKFGLDNNNAKPTLFAAETTIPERLGKVGYASAMYGKWHLGPTAQIPQHGFTHSFAQSGSRPFDANIDIHGKDRPMSALANEDYHITACSRAACATIERYKAQPFFLYIAYRAPHVPLDAPKKYLDRFPGPMSEHRRQALAMLSAVDDGVGMVLDTLEKHALRENTLIFFIADNGAPLKIHKRDTPDLSGWDGSLNDPLNGEKGMLTEGGIRVPFLVSWPGKIPAGQVYPHPVSSLDVAATAVALAGIEAPAGELDGINLMPYLSGKITEAPARKLYWRWTTQAAIRDGDWKYLRGGSREYLFNLRDDMGEKHNLMKLQPQIAQRLKTDLETWSQALIPAGLDKRDLKEGTNRYFDHYLDGKQVSVPAAKAPENAPKTEKPRKKKRQPKASPPAPQP